MTSVLSSGRIPHGRVTVCRFQSADNLVESSWPHLCDVQTSPLASEKTFVRKDGIHDELKRCVQRGLARRILVGNREVHLRVLAPMGKESEEGLTAE